jgi:hypothetical protein
MRKLTVVRDSRASRGTMNGLERDYSAELGRRKLAGEIEEYFFECMTLKLADSTRYTPDFLVITKTGLEAHEVKGFMREDAWVKLKVSAERFWFISFLLVKRVKKQWQITEV